MSAPTPPRGAARAETARAETGRGDPTRSRGRRLLLPALAAVALALGFLDLIRGGITLGPVLLTIAYCVLIPAAILRR
jgi:hypothetical protein